MSQTLNDVAALAQYRQRQYDDQIFTIRRQQWADQSVKITKFAKKSDLLAELAIQSPGNRSDILGKFQDQSIKLPHGGKSIAVPIDAKRNKADIIPTGQRPRAFNFKLVGGAHAITSVSKASNRIRAGVGRGGLQVYEGDKRTVMIRNAQGSGVILQRVGAGKKAGMRVLYLLTPKVHITPNLNFFTIATEAAQHAQEFFGARLREAMGTAR